MSRRGTILLIIRCVNRARSECGPYAVVRNRRRSLVLNSRRNKKPFNKDRNNRATARRTSVACSATAKPGFAARAAADEDPGGRYRPQDCRLMVMLDAEDGNPAYKALGESDRALVRAILNYGASASAAYRGGDCFTADFATAGRCASPASCAVVGAAQMLYLDVPDHSAVDIAVEQANQDPRNRRFAKLVNAILRRIGREKGGDPEPGCRRAGYAGLVPARLEATYGAEAALRISNTQLEPAAIDVTVKSDAEGWAKRLNGVVLPTGGMRLAAFGGARFPRSMDLRTANGGSRMLLPAFRPNCSVRLLAAQWLISAPRPAARRRNSFLPAAR